VLTGSTVLRRGAVAWQGATKDLGPDVLKHYLAEEELSSV
jgi:hypothetical protein